MVIDYSDIKSVLEPIVTEFLDHRHLNDTLAMHSPTSEAIAVWLFNKLKSHFDSRDYQLYAVEIEETDTCVTRFCPTMEL
jgi:6-pyruvoyltetrahydropterin/6-carboxytetrahydropterin synthase